MNRFLTSNKYFCLVFICLNFLCLNFVFGQVTPSASIPSLFPYRIDFTQAELIFLSKLDKESLQKLILVALNLIKSNPNITSAPQQPIPQQPSSPQYSSPSSPSSGSNSSNSQNSQSPIFGNQNDALSKYFSPSQQSPTQNINPLSQILSQSQNQSQNQNQPEPQPLDPNFKIPDNIDPACQSNYGILLKTNCSTINGLNQKVLTTTMQACSVIKKPIPISSAHRTDSCNRAVGGATGSSHKSGLAVDIIQRELSSTEKQAVFLVFKQNGFNNIGCYSGGQNANVHLDVRSGGPRRWGSDYTRNTWNPSNCPKELLQVFGN